MDFGRVQILGPKPLKSGVTIRLAADTLATLIAEIAVEL